MPTTHEVAHGAQTLADTTARIADASAQLAVVATAADDVVESSRHLIRWILISLVVLAVAGAIASAMRKKKNQPQG